MSRAPSPGAASRRARRRAPEQRGGDMGTMLGSRSPAPPRPLGRTRGTRRRCGSAARPSGFATPSSREPSRDGRLRGIPTAVRRRRGRRPERPGHRRPPGTGALRQARSRNHTPGWPLSLTSKTLALAVYHWRPNQRDVLSPVSTARREETLSARPLDSRGHAH